MPTLEPINALLLILAGLAAGVINTFAGSGSLITLPLLMFMGLPPAIANGTNRIGVVVQNLVATGNFVRQKELQPKREWALIFPTLFGSLLGATLAVEIEEDFLNYFIGGLLVVMFFVILLKPSSWIKGKAGTMPTTKSRWINTILFFFIGIYGGFIQAGVGLFLLAGLVLGAGYDLVRANAVKVLMVLAFTLVAVAVFLKAGQIVWSYGLCLAAGNAAGAWIASKYASKIGAKNIRYILLAVVLFSGLKVLGLL
ncbi:sulfite exporter TauE/SafE family protein [Thermophagus sp. OGC60D27]|uniref:sulfite exporter TauE/SafE family protein n=1 Tax=Thermophagus sp. OGC60D27 TaxID=3458415 RepID=UPI00403797DE